jgi:molybdopterin synthase catalytic subunit
VFVGSVRDHDDARGVASLSYSQHPRATRVLNEVAAEVASSFPEASLAVTHRVGDLQIGDLAVVVAAGCPHRDEAFTAARALIDEVKSRVPIWKHQRFADGSDEWVGLP